MIDELPVIDRHNSVHIGQRRVNYPLIITPARHLLQVRSVYCVSDQLELAGVFNHHVTLHLTHCTVRVVSSEISGNLFKSFRKFAK